MAVILRPAHLARSRPSYLLLARLSLGLAFGLLVFVSGAHAQAPAPAAAALELAIDGTTVRLGGTALGPRLHEDQLVPLLGAPERAKYRLLWPGRGVLAIPGTRSGEIDELELVVCDGAAESQRVGVFAGRVWIDGVELDCKRSSQEVLAALPDDFVQSKDLDAFVTAERPGLEIVLTLSSWNGVLTLSLVPRDPDEAIPAEPTVRTTEPPPPPR